MLEYLFLNGFEKLEIQNDPEYKKGYTVYYKKCTDKTKRKNKPVLIVYSYITRAYGLNLDPENSMLKKILDKGGDVYLLDWGNEGMLSHQIGWELKTYVDKIDIVIQKLKKEYKIEKLNLYSICAGTSLLLYYLEKYPNNIHKIFFNDLILFFERDCESKATLILLNRLRKFYGPFLQFIPEFPMHLVTLLFILNSTTPIMIGHVNENVIKESGWEMFNKMLLWAIDQRNFSTSVWFEVLKSVDDVEKMKEEEHTKRLEKVFKQNHGLKFFNLIAQDDYIVKPSTSSIIVNDDQILATDFHRQELTETGHFMFVRKCTKETEHYKDLGIRWLLR